MQVPLQILTEQVFQILRALHFAGRNHHRLVTQKECFAVGQTSRDGDKRSSSSFKLLLREFCCTAGALSNVKFIKSCYCRLCNKTPTVNVATNTANAFNDDQSRFDNNNNNTNKSFGGAACFEFNRTNGQTNWIQLKFSTNGQTKQRHLQTLKGSRL
jgi:ribosomal protein L44E